ncbi:hypothetical protein [Brevibacillus laterosporus]|uniref:hypothetical protein n=1 Tax=Brevibacillus laterosporus TaxID=1465 RepID=UPI002E1F8ADC|nr:hypothetical protein [Brevibacillus laterosporus]MED1667283.1 hypothetical protein [Brevibacillus laterosporus]MED1718256.1 hypothetical protein [Brevibacillus laterosporus]
MKAKVLTLGLAALLSAISTTSALAAPTEATVKASRTAATSEAIQGQHKYGRVTITSDSLAGGHISYSCDGGKSWKVDQVNQFSVNNDTFTTNYYMDGACLYKLTVGAEYNVKGYIRSYD